MVQLLLNATLYSQLTWLYVAFSLYTQQKKLRKMCSSAYCNRSSKTEIQTLVCYKVSFYLSDEASFDLVASAVAGKNNVTVD